MFLHLYKPTGADRVALVSTRPSASSELVLVTVAKGASRAKLNDAQVYGPMSETEAETVFAREVTLLKAQGFMRSGLGAMLSSLESKKRRTRALAARRLGWLQELGAFDALLALGQKANEELPVVVDALGELGDPRAIPLVRTVAEKKLLSRRRSGVEALRKLGDETGIAQAKDRAKERLPETVKEALASRGEESRAAIDVEAVVKTVMLVPTKDRGLAIDTLYELGGALAVHTAREVLAKDGAHEPHVWRYTKSVFKRSMLRHDALTFGSLAHRIELLGRSVKGTTTTVKSGYDGEPHKTPIFGRKTQDYLRRSAWRHLRAVARYRSASYAHAAAEVLVRYSTADEDAPSGRMGTYSRCYLLHRILWGTSERYELLARRMRFRLLKGASPKAPEGVREEAFPELWDAQPRAYLRLLGGAQLPVVHEFALAAIRRSHSKVVTEASPDEVVAMLGVFYAPTVELALTELRRRFIPDNPDWDLLARLLADSRPQARDLGIEWIGLTASLWATDATRIVAFLAQGDATARAAVVRHVLAALPTAPRSTREALANAIVTVLRTPEPAEGAHDGYAQLAQALADEIARLVDVDELMGLLARGSVAAKSMAARALAVRPEAGEKLGLPQLLAMAVHEQVALREASHALFLQLLPSLQRDPSPVYELLEAEWADTREFASGLLKGSIDTASLTPEALISICDSNRVDVQDLGRELVLRWLSRLDPQLLIKRLSQHPHRNMRRWTMELVDAHLREGFVPLAGLEEFFRTVLLDVSPDRSLKRAVVLFLTKRGLADERQAEVVTRLLSEFVRSKTKDDFDRAIGALTRIKVAYPSLESALSLGASA